MTGVLRLLAAVLLCLVATASVTTAQAPAAPRRPQHPKRPYPYREEEVVYENRRAGVKLAGTLTLPRGRGPFPAVVLLPGSGTFDRDETLFGHKPFLVLADHLTRRGIAVLRSDDRGVGGCTGNKMQSTTPDFAEDALCAVAFLKGRRDIDPRKIGLVGHSEGGMTASLAAAVAASQPRGGVAFVVMLAGMCLTGEETFYLQGSAILRAGGATNRQIATQRAMQEAMFKILEAEKDTEKARALILQRLQEMLSALPPEAKGERQIIEAGMAQIPFVLTPWFRYFLTYDPRLALRRLRAPLLALFCEKDLQVLPKENMAALLAALKAGGHRDHTVKVLPGLNHLFQTARTGHMNEYGQIEETFSPKALKIISDWIVSRTR